MSDGEAPDKTYDVVLIHGRTEDGVGLRGIRSRPGQLEATELRPVREGRPLGQGELVRLHQRAESPLLCDVEVQFDAGATRSGHEGPARVASGTFRENWEAIFGTGKKSVAAN
jgi:hypothetical protein